MASDRKRATYLTVGQQFNLEHACRMLSAAFGLRTYLVGSTLGRPDFRDVDLRCLLDDQEYDAVIGSNEHRLKLLNTALSEWLASRTGLPVDSSSSAYQTRMLSSMDRVTHSGSRFRRKETMARPASAYPRLSPSGRRLIAGDDWLVVDQSTEIAHGLAGQWRDEVSLVYGGHDGKLWLWREGHGSTVLREQGFNAFVVAGTRWLGWRPDTGLVWHDNVVWPEWHSPALSETRWAAIIGTTLYAGLGDGQAGQPVASGARDPRLVGNLLTWAQGGPEGSSVWGQRSHGGPVVRLSIPGNTKQGYIVPVLVDGQPWALTHDDTRVTLYPWADTSHGFVVARAPAHRPDGRQLPEGFVRIVYDAEHDVLGDALIDLRSEPRVDLRAAPTPQPERLPEGAEIDLLPFLIGDASTWPRDGDHYMHQVWDGRNLHFLKFGPMAEGSTFCDTWERLVLDGDQLFLREDRSQSGAGIYSFHPGRAFTRRMLVGEWIDVPENILQRYEKGTCRIVDQHPLPYRLGLVEAWRHFDCGGDLGIRDVIKCSYDPGGSNDSIEHFWYARGAGWFRWQEQRQDDPSRTHTTHFNRIGGVALRPTTGCYQPLQVSMSRPAITISEPTFPPEGLSIPAGGTLRCVYAKEPGAGRVDRVQWLLDGRVVADNHGDDPDHTYRDMTPGAHRIGARAMGPGGTHETGAVRIVHVGQPSTEPEPPVSNPERIVIRTNDGYWVQTNPDDQGRVIATTQSKSEATIFVKELVGDKVAIKDEARGMYVRAFGGGGSFLLADVPDVQPDALHVEGQADFGRSLMTSGGYYWSAIGGGGSSVDAVVRHALSHESFTFDRALGGGPNPNPNQPLPPSELDRIDGQLQIESGGGFVVNGRAVLPILCHFGDAFSRWSRGQQGAVASDLDDIASAGYHGIRFWSTLGLDDHGGGYWAGRQVGPTYTPDYWLHLQAFLEALRDRGLVCQFSLGDTRRVAVPDLREYAYRAGDVINAAGPHVVALGLEVNEDRDTGHQGAAKLAEFNRWFREKCPHVLVGLSAFTGTEDPGILDDYSRAPADVFVCHGYRGGHWWDKVRHIFSLVYEAKPKKRLGWQGEPAGPGSRVSAIDNRHELDADALCAMASMSLMTRQGWVHFSGPGVISDEGERLQEMPGFREVPKVRSLIPSDVMRYDRIFHGGDTWRRERVFAAEGEVRADHAMTNDGRFVAMIYGPGSLNVPQTRNADIQSDTRFGNKARLVVGRA